ncbi:MAG TPA: sugar ABC transporter substrate-binding protein [Clostridia bacterium]|nr:sugar ABC transporter substrate-binding protein [Clostridia bacterium]HRX41703.1 sugar ABC transporter substrate-binding protein [Clostridia bacterium]
MKKILCIALALVLVVGLFAGCKKHEEVTVTVQAETGWMDYYQNVKAAVEEEYPYITVEIIEIGAFDHLDALDNTSATNEEIADVFAAPADRLYGLNDNAQIAYIPAADMAKKIGGWSDYEAGLGGAFKAGENYLGIPMNIETLLFFANKANAADAGIDLTSKIELNDLSDNDLLVAYFNAWFGVAFTNAVGFELLGKDDAGNLFSDATKEWSQLNANQQALFNHLFDYWKYHQTAGEGGVPDTAWDSSNIWATMETEYASTGHSSLLLEGPWNATKFSEIAGDDFDMLPLNQVTLNGQEVAHWKGGWALVVNVRNEGNEAMMDAAEKVIEEIVNPDNAVSFYKETGKIMENVPASVYQNSSELSDADKAVIATVIEGYEGAPARPLFSEWGNVWGTWESALLSWSTAGSEPATAEEAYGIVKAAFDSMMASLE